MFKKYIVFILVSIISYSFSFIVEGNGIDGFFSVPNSYALDANGVDVVIDGFNTSQSIKTGILPSGDVILKNQDKNGLNMLDSIINFIKTSIFNLLLLVSIAFFLYIGAKLVIARGDPEAFKKAMLSFVYAGIGLFIVAFAWAAVRLVSGLNF